MKKSYRGELPAPDKRGYVRPESGGVRFTVGHSDKVSRQEMIRRITAIRDLFDNQCRFYGEDRWVPWLLPYAKKIAAGERPIVFPVSDYAAWNRGQATEEVTILETLRELGIEATPDRPDVLLAGEQELARRIDERVSRAVAVAIRSATKNFGMPPQMEQRLMISGPSDPASAETKSFHDALKAFRKHLDITGKKTDSGKLAKSPSQYKDWSRRLQETHDDFPFWQMDKNRIEELIAHWRNRPQSAKTGNRLSKLYAKHIIDALWAVLVFVDEASDWKWDMPKGARRISRTPVDLDADRKKKQTRRVSGSTYTPEQLAIIAGRLKKLERMILGLAVNCAMQPAEVGRLERLDYFMTHPETGEQADWIIFERPKTHEYGEWVLWPEVAELVRWGIRRAEHLNADRLIVNDKGVPWYKDDSKSPEGRFAKWWQAIPCSDPHEGVVTRLSREIDGFPRHTIKSLRKILPNMVRPEHGREVADLVNARKVDSDGRVGDGETDRYADRLYDAVAEAIRQLEGRFRVFLDELRD